MQLKGRLQALEITRRVRPADRTRPPGRGPQYGCTTLCAMPPGKPNNRRLAEMSAAGEPDQPWAPELPTVRTYLYTFLISATARYTQRLDCDEWDRLVEWAVIQSRLIDGRWQRVAVYDICHRKGAHIHLYDREEREFTQVSLKPVTCRRDVEEALDEALDRVIEHSAEN